MPKRSTSKGKATQLAKARNTAKTESEQNARQLKPKPYRSLRLSKRIKHPAEPLPSAYKLFKQSLRQLIRNWKLFGGIIIVYFVLTVVLVKGFGSNNNITVLKNTLQHGFKGGAGAWAGGLATYGLLLTNIGSTTSTTASTYQTILLILTSLVLIWALRQSTDVAKKKVPNFKQAFYQGVYPLIPFLLVLVVINLQLLPVLVANFLYATVFQAGLAVTVVEKVLWGMFSVMLLVLSAYMVLSSIFALYIVTLPNLAPMKALRSARDLVRNRRLAVLRKLIFLPFALLVLGSVITLPIILISPAVAEWVFFGLSMVALAVFHSYMYNLYRTLL